MTKSVTFFGRHETWIRRALLADVALIAASLALGLLFGSGNGALRVTAWILFSIGMAPIVVGVILLSSAASADRKRMNTWTSRINRELEDREAVDQQLRTSGYRTRARLLKASDDGMQIKGQLKARLELDIALEGYRTGSYQTTLDVLIPTLGRARLIPDASLPVAVDRENPDRVVILWDEP